MLGNLKKGQDQVTHSSCSMVRRQMARSASSSRARGVRLSLVSSSTALL